MENIELKNIISSRVKNFKSEKMLTKKVTFPSLKSEYVIFSHERAQKRVEDENINRCSTENKLYDAK